MVETSSLSQNEIDAMMKRIQELEENERKLKLEKEKNERELRDEVERERKEKEAVESRSVSRNASRKHSRDELDKIIALGLEYLPIIFINLVFKA